MNKKIKRVVVKLGTKLLTSSGTELNKRRLSSIIKQIADIREDRTDVIVVTSGAIGIGMAVLGFRTRPKTVPELQACAAVGQSRLMQVYDRICNRRGITVAQILLTSEDLHDRQRYLNAKNTMSELLSRKVLPIINENDTVSTEELKFGDNDMLASLVANLIEADMLILLTDVKGLYDPDKRLVCRVNRLTDEMMSWASHRTDHLGKGGMLSKLNAAHTMADSGIHCAIADGNEGNILLKVISGGKTGYTSFEPSSGRMKARKKWIKFATKTSGRIVVDMGARKALINDKSLLASGIKECSGRFDVGSVVDIYDENGDIFAKGMSNYSSVDIDAIKGMKSVQIKAIAGNRYYGEVIHKDNLVVL